MKFITAKIRDGSTCKIKTYSTIGGFKKGLKSCGCPFELDKNGVFSNYPEDELIQRQWNYNGIKFTALVNIEI